MLPVIDVHRPQGVLPTAAVRRRTVLDVQPGLLLLALVVGGVLVWRGRRAVVAVVSTPSPGPVEPGASAAEVAGIRKAAAEALDRPLP